MQSLSISQQEAALELLRRRKARSNFADFCRLVGPEDEQPAKHHLLLCDALDKVIDGKIDRLLVMMPPGSAKSTYATMRFPAYYLGRKGEKGIITASYNEKLASRFGRKVRNLVRSPDYLRAFPGVRLSQDSQAKGEWETTKEGFYFSAGIGSGIAGRRADLGIIDDPIKGRKDADSKGKRDDCWDWYIDDFRSRLKPEAAIVLIQTRWHQDDLAGRILPEKWNGESGWVEARDGENWYVICLPARAGENDILGRAPGEWLWTEWFSPEWWEQTERTARAKDVRTWNSLYQQTPKDDEGTFFKRHWFENGRFNVGEQPKHTNKYISSDFAVDEDEGDYTEFGVCEVDHIEDIWVTDWWYGKETADVWIDSLLDLVDRHRPLCVFGEAGVIRRSVWPFLSKRGRERRIYSDYQWITRDQNKAAMARAIQARAAQGKVHIPNTAWGDRLIDNLVDFPSAKNDDAFDVMSLMGLALDDTVGGAMPPEAPAASNLNDYTSEHEDIEADDSWKMA